MRIETLQHFLEVASSGSFYSASHKLFISQQGLNKSIRSLEEELDTHLLERSHSGVKLTDDGAVFAHHAERILEDYELMMADLFESKHRRTTGEAPIPLSISYYAAQTAASNPNYVHLLVNSEYVELPFEKLVERAASKDYEGLVFLDIHGASIANVNDNPLLEFEPIIATRFGIVVREGSLFSSKKNITVEEIRSQPFAYNTHCEMRHILEELFGGDIPADIRLGTTSPRMLLERVQAPSTVLAGFDSFGFFLAQNDDSINTENLAFVPLEGTDAIGFVGFLKRRDAETSQRARYVKRVLRQWLEAHVSAYLTQYPAKKLWSDVKSATPNCGYVEIEAKGAIAR